MDNEFNLERTIAGEPIETEAGTPVEFVAYRPTAQGGKQLIVQDGGDIRTYYANGRYHGLAMGCPLDLRMKSVVKCIDWAKLPVDTLIIINDNGATCNRYFHSFRRGVVRYYKDGKTSKTADSNLDVFAISPSNAQIAPDQPWTVWQGGACPIPEGLEYEVVTRGGAAPMNNRGGYRLTLWSHTQNGFHSMSEIIAYRLTGKMLDRGTL
jgi:hypothetical protein